MHTIEQNLQRIADALEKIAGNAGILAVEALPATVVSTVVETREAKDDAEAKAKAKAKAAADKAAADKMAAEKKALADKAVADEAAAAKAADEAAAAAALGDKPKPKTKDDVRKALQAYREIEGTPAMLEVLKKHGAANLNELAESQYDAVVAAVS